MQSIGHSSSKAFDPKFASKKGTEMHLTSKFYDPKNHTTVGTQTMVDSSDNGNFRSRSMEKKPSEPMFENDDMQKEYRRQKALDE